MNTQRACYPIIMSATPDRARMEISRMLGDGEKIAVLARTKRRAKCFSGLVHEDLSVIDAELRSWSGINRAWDRLQDRFDVIFLLRDRADELMDGFKFNDAELQLLSRHLMHRLTTTAVFSFAAFEDALNVYALHPGRTESRASADAAFGLGGE
ncbi:hypothetical protein HFO24_05005 [Rhizobium laguerreae]|uniref:hypothetical protein n=1 Tax=Rhizobium laguerreae TaxID=1076926 RepID=UPI001C90F18E|nr:hypothetical protein [Rhizobium laguerreae]MBY3181030.1 hypothetical protein [Rhizobium laguerreae]